MKRNIFLTAILMGILNLFFSNTLLAQSKDVWLAKVEIDGSPAIIDINGNYVVRPGIYENIDFDDFSEGMCPVTREGKEGYIDIYGNEVVPCQWKYVTKFENGFGRVNIQSREDNIHLCGLVDKTGRLVVPLKYSYVEPVRNSDLIRTEGPSCLYNSNGDLLIENVYSIQRSSTEGKLIVTGNHGGPYFVDEKGNKCSERFFDASPFSGGYAVIQLYNGNKEPIYAYLDSKGNILRFDEYEWLGSFYEDGYALVSRGFNQKGVINSKFEEVIPCIYEEISTLLYNYQKSKRKELFIGGLAKVKKNGEYALINSKNEIVVPFGKYRDFHMLTGNVIEATTFNRQERKDKSGNLITFSTYVIIDKEGNQLSDQEYENIFDFYKGFAVVRNEDMYGIIDSQGKEVIPCKYKYDEYTRMDIKDFVDYGVVRIKKNGRWGLLNRKGELIVPATYDKMSAFEDGLSLVNRGIMWATINPVGEFDLGLCFISAVHTNFSGGRLGIKQEIDGKKKYGYIDPKGEVLIPCKFDKVSRFKNVGFD